MNSTEVILLDFFSEVIIHSVSKRVKRGREKKPVQMSDTHQEGFFYFGVNSLQIAPCICPICKFIKTEREKKKALFFPPE